MYACSHIIKWTFSGHLTWVNHMLTVCVVCMCVGFLMHPEFSYDALSPSYVDTMYKAQVIFHSHKSVILNGFFWLHLNSLNPIWEWRKQETNVFHTHCIQLIYSLFQPQKRSKLIYQRVPRIRFCYTVTFFYLSYHILSPLSGRLFVYFTYTAMELISYGTKHLSLCHVYFIFTCNWTSSLYQSGSNVYV